MLLCWVNVRKSRSKQLHGCQIVKKYTEKMGPLPFSVNFNFRMFSIFVIIDESDVNRQELVFKWFYIHFYQEVQSTLHIYIVDAGV